MCYFQQDSELVLSNVMANLVGFKTKSLALIADAVRYSFTSSLTAAADPCDYRAKFHYFNVRKIQGKRHSPNLIMDLNFFKDVVA